jgi:hypothetical protein
MNPPYEPAGPKKRPFPIGWVLGGIFGSILLCCGGLAGLGFWGYSKGMQVAEESSPFVSSVLTQMSDSGYKFEAVQGHFDKTIFEGIRAKQFQVAMDAYREKLGKFVSIGKATGFNVRTYNGRTTQSASFDARFERAAAKVRVTFTKEGDKRSIISFYITSPVLK